MRTTLTLDDDLATRLRSESRRSGRPFKDVLNECLRRGIEAPPSLRAKRAFRVRVRALGVRPGLDYDNMGDLLEQLEGPSCR